MSAHIVGGELQATVDAFTIDDRFDNKLVSKLIVSGPESGGETKTVPMRQTAPRRYEARLPLAEYGSLLLRAEHMRAQDDGTLAPVAVSYGHVSNPYPAEYASFETDFNKLERVALASGGRNDPQDWRALFDPDGEEIKYHHELWPRAVMAAIGIYLVDLLLRRVRLFDRKFLPPRRKRRKVAAQRVVAGRGGRSAGGVEVARGTGVFARSRVQLPAQIGYV